MCYQRILNVYEFSVCHSIYFIQDFQFRTSERWIQTRGRYGECFLNLIDGWQPFCPGRFWFCLRNVRAVNVRAVKKEERKARLRLFRTTPPSPCSHLCVLTRMYTRVSVNPIGDIPGCILHSACTRIIRKTPPIMIIRTLHRDPDVCPWHVRSDGSSYTWSVRGQFLSYPLWSRSRAVMPTISDRRTAVRIDAIDYCGNTA